MPDHRLEKHEWRSYFDRLTKHLVGERAEIELAGLAFGDTRIEAKWLPLIGITYDSKNDVLEIALQGLDHLVKRPRDIIVSDGAEGLDRMDIVDADERKQTIKLMKPLSYPRRAARH